MNEIEELLSLINDMGGAASIEKIIEAYCLKHHMIKQQQYKTAIEETMKKYPKLVVFSEEDKLWKAVSDSNSISGKTSLKAGENIAKSESLYTFEEASQLMDDLGLARLKRADDISLKYRQFAVNSSSMHIKTSKKKEFILYCTIKDFGNISFKSKEVGKETRTITSHSKAEVEAALKEIKQNESDAIVLIPNGNRILHSSAENSLPNEIVAYTNENFEFLISVLAENPINLSQGKNDEVPAEHRKFVEEILDKLIAENKEISYKTETVKSTPVSLNGERVVDIYYRKGALRINVKLNSVQYQIYQTELAGTIAYQKPTANPQSTGNEYAFFVDDENLEEALRKLLTR